MIRMDYKGSIDIKAPLEKVRNALTDEKELVRYFPSTAKADPRKGGKWQFTWEFDRSSDMGRNKQVFRNEGEFVEVSPTEVSYTWWAGKDFSASASGVENHQTKVRFSLSKKGDSTEVTLVHTGFKTEEEYKDHKHGWDSVLESLKNYLEGGKDRRKEFGQIIY